VTEDATETHATSEQLIENIQEHPHKLYIEVFLSPGLFNNLTKKIVVGQLDSPFNPEDGGSTFIPNIGRLLLDSMVLYPRT
jgi:hypothetical protein